MLSLLFFKNHAEMFKNFPYLSLPQTAIYKACTHYEIIDCLNNLYHLTKWTESEISKELLQSAKFIMHCIWSRHPWPWFTISYSIQEVITVDGSICGTFCRCSLDSSIFFSLCAVYLLFSISLLRCSQPFSYADMPHKFHLPLPHKFQ